MIRTERLFTLLQILRTYRRPVSGQRLAERLNISIRTLYRDISTLQSQGAEIAGEPGIGYILKPSFFIPPLMFTQTEIEALMLGMLWVSKFADAPLATGASDALAKITHVLPSNIRNGMNAVPLRVGPPAPSHLEKEDLSSLRDAIRNQQKIRITYRSQDGKESQRIIWPFTIGYFTDRRILVGWCEKQAAFRHFRTDGIRSMVMLEKHYERARESLFREWHATQMQPFLLAQKTEQSPR
jgi:predicted DNA-binding transcriptional regulator YafY